jgi:hypothetical protein
MHALVRLLPAVQALPLIEHVWREILRHQEMALRHIACRMMLRGPSAPRASKVHQPEHKQLAQCCSGQQSAALLQTDVDAVQVALLNVNLRQSATGEYSLPTQLCDTRQYRGWTDSSAMNYERLHRRVLACTSTSEIHHTHTAAAERQGHNGKKGCRGS